MELLLVVFALFAIATPFATVYLLWRQHQIRQRLLKLTELSMEVSDGLRRDLMELKRQVEAGARVPAQPRKHLPMHPYRALSRQRPLPILSRNRLNRWSCPRRMSRWLRLPSRRWPTSLSPGREKMRRSPHRHP